ncbi:MAG: S1 RNA-binding domain-containing protein [Candidatus Sumerlaeaceae bacterium]
MTTDKKPTTQHVSNAGDDDEDFEALLNQHLPKALPKTQGEIVEATVIAVLDDVVLVAVGSKEESEIPAAEFMDPRGLMTVHVGESIRVMLTGWDEDHGAQLSYKQARVSEASGMLGEAAKAGVPVRGTVTRAVSSGVIVDVNGVDAFMPGSQVDTMRVPDLASFVGQEIEAYVLEFDAQKGRAVLSRRKLLEERKEAAKSGYLKTIEPGSIVTGTVRQVLAFGAFVSLGTEGSVDALLPRSELTYDRGIEPASLVTIGQQLQVKVLEMDQATGKITVSRKRLHEDPWEKIEQNFPVGSTVTGKIASIQGFGAFVNLQEGITGLLHNKDLSWSADKKSAQQELREGDNVSCLVTAIDKEQKRLSLSLKHLTRDPWSDVEQRYPVGSKHVGTVAGVKDFGAFVKLDENTQGLLHVSDLSWERRPVAATDVLEEGQQVEVVVLELDAAKRRVKLGAKQMSASPFTRFSGLNPVGSLVKGTITRLVPYGAFVELAPGLEGLIHISELDENRVDSPERVVRIGEEVTAKILEINPDKQRIGLSRKQAFQQMEQENMQAYMKQQEPAKGSGSAFGAAFQAALSKKKP